MMRLTICACVMVLVPVVGLAQGTLSVPYTAVQQKGAVEEVARVNAARATDGLPAFTVIDFAVAACQNQFDVWVDRMAERRATFRTNVQLYKSSGWTDAQRDAVDAYIAACESAGTCPAVVP